MIFYINQENPKNRPVEHIHQAGESQRKLIHPHPFGYDSDQQNKCQFLTSQKANSGRLVYKLWLTHWAREPGIKKHIVYTHLFKIENINDTKLTNHKP